MITLDSASGYIEIPKAKTYEDLMNQIKKVLQINDELFQYLYFSYIDEEEQERTRLIPQIYDDFINQESPKLSIGFLDIKDEKINNQLNDLIELNKKRFKEGKEKDLKEDFNKLNLDKDEEKEELEELICEEKVEKDDNIENGNSKSDILSPNNSYNYESKNDLDNKIKIENKIVNFNSETEALNNNYESKNNEEYDNGKKRDIDSEVLVNNINNNNENNGIIISEEKDKNEVDNIIKINNDILINSASNKYMADNNIIISQKKSKKDINNNEILIIKQSDSDNNFNLFNSNENNNEIKNNINTNEIIIESDNIDDNKKEDIYDSEHNLETFGKEFKDKFNIMKESLKNTNYEEYNKNKYNEENEFENNVKKIIELNIDNLKNDILNSGIFEKPMIENKSKLNHKYSKVIHQGIKCNNCGVNPIMGIRYKCMECDNFNFCENCEENVGHPHLFYKIKKNNSLLKN